MGGNCLKWRLTLQTQTLQHVRESSVPLFLFQISIRFGNEFSFPSITCLWRLDHLQIVRISPWCLHIYGPWALQLPHSYKTKSIIFCILIRSFSLQCSLSQYRPISNYMASQDKNLCLIFDSSFSSPLQPLPAAGLQMLTTSHPNLLPNLSISIHTSYSYLS